MALAAIGFAKAMRRRQFMAATSSVGPGAMNMVTAAAVAHANRLPLLLLAGDTFALAHPRSRAAAGRALRRAVGHASTTRSGRSRATGIASRSPAQVAQSLPLAIATHARPGRLRAGLHRAAAGRAGRGLRLPRAAVRAGRARAAPAAPRPPRAGGRRRRAARRQGAADRRRGRRPLQRSPRPGCGASPRRHGVPVVETMAGKSTLVADHPLYAGPIGVTGCPQANALAAAGATSCSPSARGCRTSRPARGRSSATTTCASSASTPRASTPPSTAACRSSPTRSRASRRSARRSAAGRSPRPGARRRARRPPRTTSTCARCRPAPGRERAVLRAGHRGGQRRGRARRLRGLGRGRLPRRAQRRLARARRRHVRLRVRLLVHGLRARGRLGRAHGAHARRGVRVRRRRLVPDAQLRAAELGDLGPQAHRRCSATTAASP